MHAFHPDIRRLAATAAAALMLTVAALALPSVAGDLELSLRGGPEGSAGGAASQVVVRPSPSPPRWVADPLSPPAFTVR